MKIKIIIFIVLITPLCSNNILNSYSPLSNEKIQQMQKNDATFYLALAKIKDQIKQLCGIYLKNIESASFTIAQGVIYNIVFSTDLGKIQASVVVRLWEEYIDILNMKFIDDGVNRVNQQSKALPEQGKVTNSSLGPSSSLNSLSSRSNKNSSFIKNDSNITNLSLNSTNSSQIEPSSAPRTSAAIKQKNNQNTSKTQNNLNNKLPIIPEQTNKKLSSKVYASTFKNMCQIQISYLTQINSLASTNVLDSTFSKTPTSIQEAAANPQNTGSTISVNAAQNQDNRNNPPRILQSSNTFNIGTEYHTNNISQKITQKQQITNFVQNKIKISQIFAQKANSQTAIITNQNPEKQQQSLSPQIYANSQNNLKKIQK